jgi:hypothetical protein
VNEVINLKKRRPLELAARPFESFARGLDDSGDAPTPDEPGEGPGALLVEEAKIGCTLGMLMCLDRVEAGFAPERERLRNKIR